MCGTAVAGTEPTSALRFSDRLRRESLPHQVEEAGHLRKDHGAVHAGSAR